MKKDIKTIKLSPRQQKITERVTDLILKRVFMKIDSNLGEKDKQEMEKVFASTDDKQKALFIKKYAPDFTEMLREETIKTVAKIKNRVNKKNV